jgi:hypothetical protein
MEWLTISDIPGGRIAKNHFPFWKTVSHCTQLVAPFEPIKDGIEIVCKESFLLQ